jgi:hypothetical protein
LVSRFDLAINLVDNCVAIVIYKGGFAALKCSLKYSSFLQFKIFLNIFSLKGSEKSMIDEG